ncbi:MAG: hypothetical protein R2708_11270 [Vicinamibacterales bacterium]
MAPADGEDRQVGGAGGADQRELELVATRFRRAVGRVLRRAVSHRVDVAPARQQDAVDAAGHLGRVVAECDLHRLGADALY